MACYSVSHLVRRGGVYCFRMAVPRALVAQFGRREIKGSLKTGDPFTARTQCRKLSSAFEKLIKLVGEMPDLKPETITALIQEYFRRCLEQAEEIAEFMPEDQRVDQDFEVNSLRDGEAALRKQLARRDYDNITRLDVDGLLRMAAVEGVQPASKEYRDLCQGVLHARIEQHRILIAKLTGDPNQEPVSPLFRGATALQQGCTEPLAAVADAYCEYHTAKGAWVHKTVLDQLRTLNLFLAVTGSMRPLGSLSANDVMGFLTTLYRLPANYMKSRANQGKPLDDVLLAPKAEGTLSPKTVQKYFEMMKAFLKWCVMTERLPAVPGALVTADQSDDDEEGREPYTKAELVALFSSPMYTGHKTLTARWTPGDMLVRDGKFWVPLVGLFSGLRLGEIVQLQVGDIRTDEDSGIPYFDVNKEEDPQKRLKSGAAKRKAPVHPVLIAMGLLDHVEAKRQKDPQSRVFPDIEAGNDGYYSSNFSKWWRYFTTKIGAKRKKVTFHSLRHNFKDALVIGEVEETRRMMLMGHSRSNVHAGYGSKFLSMADHYKDVCRVAFPFLSLYHLYVSTKSV